MQIRKNIVIRMISASAIMCTAISMAVFPSYATAADADVINSKGNIVLEDGEVALYAADAGYLQDELDSLYQELPEISNSAFYGTARKSGLNSKGIIDYADGTVVIDSSDFAYLADEIDLLEAEYKANAVSALNAMGTFFLSDGSINHELDDENFPKEAAALSFETIYEGIKQSQSVDHLAEQDIAGAVENNISEGTAAWLDGELIIGNGADNDAYYKQGFVDGQLSLYDKASISYVYHEHSGNSTETTVYTDTNPGGCYVGAGHTHNAINTCPTTTVDTGPCSSTHFHYGCWEHDIPGSDGEGCWICEQCGRHSRGWSGSESWTCNNSHYKEVYNCGSPVNTWTIGCGKIPSVTIESATIVFNN